MRFRRVSFADKVPNIRHHLRRRIAVSLGLAALLVLSVVGAAAAGAFASPVAAQRTAAAKHPAVEQPAANHRAAATKVATGHRPLTTSCVSLGHIGDSTSVGMVSPQDLPDPAQRLAAQYANVGVKHLWVDASGGRSIVETLPGQTNGYNVARNWTAKGFHGCWVFALGTNDTGNVAVGSSVGRMARIDQMMTAAHGQPVMWVNTHTLLSSGPFSEANMQAWNDDLVKACAQYPNMRVFNWDAIDQPGWHAPDGIHYTSAGYAVRAEAIAHALAKAFPSTGHSTGCLVG